MLMRNPALLEGYSAVGNMDATCWVSRPDVAEIKKPPTNTVKVLDTSYHLRCRSSAPILQRRRHDLGRPLPHRRLLPHHAHMVRMSFATLSPTIHIRP